MKRPDSDSYDFICFVSRLSYIYWCLSLALSLFARWSLLSSVSLSRDPLSSSSEDSLIVLSESISSICSVDSWGTVIMMLPSARLGTFAVIVLWTRFSCGTYEIALYPRWSRGPFAEIVRYFFNTAPRWIRSWLSDEAYIRKPSTDLFTSMDFCVDCWLNEGNCLALIDFIVYTVWVDSVSVLWSVRLIFVEIFLC